MHCFRLHNTPPNHELECQTKYHFAGFAMCFANREHVDHMYLDREKEEEIKGKERRERGRNGQTGRERKGERERQSGGEGEGGRGRERTERGEEKKGRDRDGGRDSHNLQHQKTNTVEVENTSISHKIIMLLTNSEYGS